MSLNNSSHRAFEWMHKNWMFLLFTSLAILTLCSIYFNMRLGDLNASQADWTKWIMPASYSFLDIANLALIMCLAAGLVRGFCSLIAGTWVGCLTCLSLFACISCIIALDAEKNATGDEFSRAQYESALVQANKSIATWQNNVDNAVKFKSKHQSTLDEVTENRDKLIEKIKKLDKEYTPASQAVFELGLALPFMPKWLDEEQFRLFARIAFGFAMVLTPLVLGWVGTNARNTIADRYGLTLEQAGYSDDIGVSYEPVNGTDEQGANDSEDDSGKKTQTGPVMATSPVHGPSPYNRPDWAESPIRNRAENVVSMSDWSSRSGPVQASGPDPVNYRSPDRPSVQSIRGGGPAHGAVQPYDLDQPDESGPVQASEPVQFPNIEPIREAELELVQSGDPKPDYYEEGPEPVQEHAPDQEREPVQASPASYSDKPKGTRKTGLERDVSIEILKFLKSGVGSISQNKVREEYGVGKGLLQLIYAESERRGDIHRDGPRAPWVRVGGAE